MTDLVTLIKTAIENVPQKDGNGRLDTQAMAEAAAKVALNWPPKEQWTYGHCVEKQKPGGCQLHNLHCQYPDCDRKAAT